MYEKSDIQNQFPVNEKKLWWVTFLPVMLWGSLSSLAIAYVLSKYFTIFNGFGDNYLYVSMAALSLIILLGNFLLASKLATNFVKSLYFDVSGEGVVVKYTIIFPVVRGVLFSTIKRVTLHRVFFISNIYRVILVPHTRSYNRRRGLLAELFIPYGFSISGFDHETAVAFKEFLEKRVAAAQK